MYKWLMSWLTMRRKECMFTDRVTGEPVFRYIDCYGHEWIAGLSPYGFRVRIKRVIHPEMFGG